VAVSGRGTASSAVDPPPSAVAKPGRQADEPGPTFLAASYLVLFTLGFTLALLGAFFLAAGPRVGTTLVLPIGLAIAVVGHLAAGWLGLQLTGTRAGTLTPLLGWVVVIIPLSSGTSQGDVVLPNSLLAVAFLLFGLGSYGLVAVLTRPWRGRSARGLR
jgi:hypothetical protein